MSSILNFGNDKLILVQFIRYIATELCLCSVADLFDPVFEHHNRKNRDDKMAILKSLTAKSILLQSTKGLECLHQQNIVLGYLKPSNFLIKEIRTANGSHRYTVKITFADFLLGKLRVKIRKLTRSEEPFWKKRSGFGG